VFSATSTSGGDAIAGRNTNGTGVAGVSTNGVGVYASSTQNDGIQAFSSAANKSGVWGSNGAGGFGVSGSSTSGVGVYASSEQNDGIQAFSGAANKSGVWGSNNSAGIGVTGSSSGGDPLLGGGYGVYGISSNRLGRAVYGRNTRGPGQGTAGWFYGDVTVEGLLSVTGWKNFKIDHPLDPANKFLIHSCVESNELMNIYNGNVTLDANGEAVVMLPAWFEALNKEFRYQLTPIGAPGPNLYIAQEISGNRFKIAGGGAGMKVSWLVTGIRHDPFAEAHRMQVEVEKTGRERGKYIHPKEYGVSETLGIDYEENEKIKAELERMQAEHEKMNLERQRMRPQPLGK
jgi:hypothetical protein